jgi:UPF0716 protein FxsA
MRFLLLVLFLAYPILELALLIKVGGAIGVLPLLGIILATAVLGVLALRQHGITLLRRMGEEMASGRPPLAPVIEGALLGAAGLLLIAPGLITDVAGLLLLVAPARQAIAARLARSVIQAGAEPASWEVRDGEAPREEPETQPRFGGDRRFGGRRPRRDPGVIEGEYERIEERTLDPRDDKGPKGGSRPADDS